MNRITAIVLTFLFSSMLFSQQRDLNFYIEQAKKTSPLIKKNENDNRIITLNHQQIERVLKGPVISLESSLVLSPIIAFDNDFTTFAIASDGSHSYVGYDLSATNGGQYQALVSIVQPLLGDKYLKPYIEKAGVSLKQNKNEINMTSHEIEQLVGYQYFLCLKSKYQRNTGEINLKLVEDQLITLRKLVESAVYKQSDLMLLEIERQNILLANKAFDDNYKSNIYDLNLLCGVKDKGLVDIQDTELSISPNSNKESKFFESYRLDSLAIVADQSINDLKYKPQLNIFANAGYNATGLLSLDHFGFSAGLSFGWTLYDGNQRKLEREKSKVYISTVQFEKEHFKTQREINIDKIVSQLKALAEQERMLDDQLKQYDKLYKAYADQLAHGLISVMDFKNLLKDITSKKQDFQLLKMDKQLLINSYNYWNY